ncbi:MAG: TlyA family rRNA (cytidine-2'-O)-methyltransferase [Sneathiella sp.]|jgi:23S rRNA (cytidine1920-2'-O)/16S rRNA (cytidine1409-2'-O)-methyltransferase|uniref:TlyA family RNA methyltransferase n=1 Tax=Sneathiella sp. TaxID=1964365 RepID=UPI000C4E6B9A|nr:TlyA family RNA methyltransferase [Sneathiella sp.]MAL78110.1 TlyA family rRNA (cytidine-2'-O)-methyltransferase [Sneathiella sp.]|tara:strand:+ start:189 stop:938 length:750 start_codon:yes stop_codon:yes gene_type:complete
MTETSQRLDLALVARDLVKSRARAQSLIAEGRVSVNGEIADKANRKVTETADITLDIPDMQWVGRGAVKLLAALDHFGLSVKGRIAADIGASTGGFTQVLLSRDVRRVYAVDVGHDQLDPVVGEDPRVVNLEKTNSKDLDTALIPDALDLIVADVSFISLTKALPAVLDLAAPGADLVALVKPQFEVGKGNVGKGGIVRDAALADRVPMEMESWINARPGWRSLGTMASPILGSDGNREFLMGARHVGN